ncbi:MAG: PIN domain-containing protein [Prevotellaceae bacterium]|jgi:predicted nucleic acid-binding protein|nr:PIN domain-containing protein [Prevotellaceae bacterium]
MKNIFADTNVIIDFLAARKPFYENAVTVFALAEKQKINIYISSLSVNNIYYILRKLGYTHQRIINRLSQLFLLVTILPVTDAVLKQASQSEFPDFEDATQYFTACQQPGINAIITRDTKGYKTVSLPVLTPSEYLKVEN